jgi:hypothetical protein
MTPAEREEQRLSFAYGNASISNPTITRAMIDQVARELALSRALKRRLQHPLK